MSFLFREHSVFECRDNDGEDDLLRSRVCIKESTSPIDLLLEAVDIVRVANSTLRAEWSTVDQIQGWRDTLIAITTDRWLVTLLPEARLEVAKSCGEPAIITWQGRPYSSYHTRLCAQFMKLWFHFAQSEMASGPQWLETHLPTESQPYLDLENAAARRLWREHYSKFPEPAAAPPEWQDDPPYRERIKSRNARLTALIVQHGLRQAAHPWVRLCQIIQDDPEMKELGFSIMRPDAIRKAVDG